MTLKSGAPNGDNIEMAFVTRIYLRIKPGGYSFSVLLALFLALAGSRVSAEPVEAEEVRAIWVTRWDYRSAGDIRTIVQNCKSLGLNRIYFQVRGRSDAFYRSSYEPWAEELGGVDPGFDPLAIAVSEAGKNAMQLHAWANVLAGWKGKVPPKNKSHLYHTHPDWFLTDRDGKTWRSSSHYSMLNPCNPEVRKHLASVLGDLVARYKVDGLHLDYIRFVFPDPDKKGQVPYDNKTLRAFRNETKGFPSRYPARWDEFRRKAVDAVVRDISRAARAARPRCVVSAAVIRDLSRGRKVFLQDSPTWLRSGWIDDVLPMNYEASHARFEELARKDIAQAGRDHLILGLGAHIMDGGADLRRQIGITRKLESPGYALFAYSSFFPTSSHASTKGREAERNREALRSELIRLNRRRR